ncbi:ATP-dependent zinc protease [Marinobacter subterrani]|uniref:ATP-dependent zinc protease family protein n=1 Tax=Marinobacter subterrani TaxID=1658765 RepID=UPI0023555EAC|nr:ATP-dependent zinc protease [Marinobacter subterrani]
MRFRGKILLIGTLLAISTFVHPAESTDNVKNRIPDVLGFVEWVVLKDTSLRLKSRLDTGARTSSLHAVNVEPFEKDDQEWVRFQIPLGDHDDQPTEGTLEHEDVILKFERPVERTVLIKRKGAPSQRRYVVRMEFCIAGTIHETQFSLADRGRFSYPVLLGRRFMGDDEILVDSSDSFLAEQECHSASLEDLAQRNEGRIVDEPDK